MTIKVLHIVLSMETGGLENGIVNLVNHSSQDQFTVDVLCLRERGELADRVTNPNSTVIYDGNNKPGILTAIKKVYLACKNGEYDIIHSHGFTTMLAAYIGGKLAKVPIIMNGEHGTMYYSSLKKRLIQKYLFKKMKINLTVSAELKQRLINRFNLTFDNFHPIINGVDTSKFCPKPSTLKSELGIDEESLIVGSVGRFVSIKNYPNLIIAFSNTITKAPTIHLVLAGDGPEMNNIDHLIDSLNIKNNVHLLGRRDDIPNVINGYDVFVLPSFSEGLSNTLLESMSCGVPVIATQVGGNPEIVLPDKTGKLYPSDDAEALSSALMSLVNNQKQLEILSANSRNHILENYSITSMVNNYEATYKQLLT